MGYNWRIFSLTGFCNRFLLYGPILLCQYEIEVNVQLHLSSVHVHLLWASYPLPRPPPPPSKVDILGEFK